MNTLVKIIVSAAISSVTSGLIGYKVAQKKYYKQADKEVKELTAYYEQKISQIKEANNVSKSEGPTEPAPVAETKSKKGRKPKLPVEEVSSIQAPTSNTQKRYKDYTKTYKSESMEEVSKDPHKRRDLVAEEKTEHEEIEIIAPDEFGDKLYGYYTDALYYYQDGVLADEMDNPIYDVEDRVGPDALRSFGRYEDDRVCVRNHKLQQDYEIYLSLKDFKDILKSKGESVGPEDE